MFVIFFGVSIFSSLSEVHERNSLFVTLEIMQLLKIYTNLEQGNCNKLFNIFSKFLIISSLHDIIVWIFHMYRI